jgi:hypothetical protein
MANPKSEKIRARRHPLGEEAGKPEGRDEEFRHHAEQELRAEDDQLDKLKEPPNNLPG